MRPPPGRWQEWPLRCVECSPTQRGCPRATPARMRRDRGARRAPADSLGPGDGPGPVDCPGPSPLANPRGDSGSIGLRAPGRSRVVRQVEEEVLDLVEPAGVQFRCRFVLSHVIASLSVRRSKSVQHPAGRGAPPPSR